MEWAGIAKIFGILAILAIISVWGYFTLQAFKHKWQADQQADDRKRTDDAIKDLADNLYSDDDFSVLHRDKWGTTSPKTDSGVRLESPDADKHEGQ